MKKKIALSLVAVVAVAGGVAAVSAFEAHVINVTAKIENALSVPTEPIDFGTVFPQEELDRDLHIELSQSFLDEPDADDVEYIIRQKPKCAEFPDAAASDGIGQTWTGHVVVEGDATRGFTTRIDCEQNRPENVTGGGALPLLCPYLSKHKGDDGVETDSELDAFHDPWTVDAAGALVWTDTAGRLAKSAVATDPIDSTETRDIRDWWVIDLKVPCFGGNCAQDWADFVIGINPAVSDPDAFVQPIENEEKIFGCDLWVEVTGVSRFSDVPPVVPPVEGG